MCRLLWCAVACLSVIPRSHAQDTASPTTAQIAPADVFRQLAAARQEIELIRLELGKPPTSPPPIKVDQASPREVYFQAAALFTKADRLAFEHTRERAQPPPPPPGDITPADVLKVVEAALGRLRSAKASLPIPEQALPPEPDPATRPSDVYNQIITANRELNGLLDRRFAPSDVYQQTTVAIAYLARLLDSPDQPSTPPPPPPFERRKRPADVYRELIACFQKIRQIGERCDIPMLVLHIDEERLDQVAPSDVYDIAAILVSELAHLHRLRPDAAPPRQTHNPGNKLPSHVFQLAGIVSAQIDALHEKIETQPGWLKK